MGTRHTQGIQINMQADTHTHKVSSFKEAATGTAQRACLFEPLLMESLTY